MDEHRLCSDDDRPGDGKRSLALGVLLGEAADQRHWHTRSCGISVT